MSPVELLAIAANLADMAAKLAAHVASGAHDPAEQLPRATAAQIAKCSTPTLTAACRRGELPMFGKQRSRTVRRSDLDAWIESRRVRPVAGADDVDMQRRMARLSRSA